MKKKKKQTKTKRKKIGSFFIFFCGKCSRLLIVLEILRSVALTLVVVGAA